MLKAVKIRHFTFSFVALLALTGCMKADPKQFQQAPETQKFSPQPEFPPNVTPQDMEQMKRDYKAGLTIQNPLPQSTDNPDQQRPSLNPAQIEHPTQSTLILPRSTITTQPLQGLLNEPVMPGPQPEPSPVPVEPSPIPVEPIPSPFPPDEPPPVTPEPTPPPAPVPAPAVVPPRYTTQPTFNIVRVRLFPLFKRDTPVQDPFVPNAAEKRLILNNPNGLSVIDIATKRVLGTGISVKFDMAANAITVDSKKISALAKVEVVPTVHGTGTVLVGLKESTNKTDGFFKYDGSFVFARSTVTNQAGKAVVTWHLINLVYLEDYVLSVTPSEIPQKWMKPEENAGEAAKAQAVAARSYGLNTIATARRNAPTREWDIVPTTANQAYFGIRFISDNARRLVGATAGKIMTHNGQVILAAFSSNSGGHTCSAKDCWGNDVPYLQPVPDLPEVRDLPGGQRQVFVGRVAFQRVLKAHRIIVNVNSPAQSITTLKTNGSNRVTQITVKVANKIFNLNAAQTNSVLNSSFRGGRQLEFGELTNNQFPITILGFGHAIGMSQWGAYAHSRRGTNFEDILKFYYSNIEIISLAD